MKRTNLVLDEALLDEARVIAGVRTYSEAVNKALLSFIRKQTFAKIDQYAGSDVWDGELGQTRADVPR